MSSSALELFLRDLGALFRARRLYPAGNEQVVRAAERASSSLAAWGHPVRMAVLDDEFVVEGQNLGGGFGGLVSFLRALRESGYESATIDAGVSRPTLEAWIEHVALGRSEVFQGDGIVTGTLSLGALPSAEASSEDDPVAADLLPRIAEALSHLAESRAEGLRSAREIVGALTAHLALGEGLIRPVSDLKEHDDYTFTHALNVSCLCAALGQALGAPPELVDVIALAGLCHDVGKQLIPKTVLNARGPLDEHGRELMDAHPAHGARILLSATGHVPALVVVVAYQHHMRVDRSGYPRLPSGGPPHAVSLLASIADAYDAMRTVRPYRAARTVAEASTALLEEVSRSRLHRRQVGAFLGLLGVLAPGRAVRLSDGRAVRVVAKGPDPLLPMVETAEGEGLDLAAWGAPEIAAITEEVG